MKEVSIMHLVLALLLFILNAKNKTWRKIPNFALSIFYVSFFNAMYYFLCKDFILWDFKDKRLSTKTLRLLHIFIINPLLILYYLSHFPKRIFSKISYVMNWVTISMIVERIGKQLNKIYFANGWNMQWSFFIYVCMFTFSRLILKRPFLTWVLSAIVTISLIKKFKVPVNHHINWMHKESSMLICKLNKI